MSSWYKTGKEGQDQVEVEQQKQQEKFDAPRRFWLKPDSNTDILFLDSAGLVK